MNKLDHRLIGVNQVSKCCIAAIIPADRTVALSKCSKHSPFGSVSRL